MTDDSRIELRYFAISNKRAGNGWLPMVTNNGHRELGEWASFGYSKEEAEVRAEEKARDVADQIGRAHV